MPIVETRRDNNQRQIPGDPRETKDKDQWNIEGKRTPRDVRRKAIASLQARAVRREASESIAATEWQQRRLFP